MYSYTQYTGCLKPLEYAKKMTKIAENSNQEILSTNFINLELQPGSTVPDL